MAKQVAVVRLAPGEIGYYDELSKLRLTIQSPKGIVYSDMDCSRLRQAIIRNQLELVTGALIPVTASFNETDIIEKGSDVTPELTNLISKTVYEEEKPSTDSKPKKTQSRKKRKKKED